jgi:hypothetical protein
MAGSTPGATQPTLYSKTGPLPKGGHAAAIDALDDPRQPLLGPRDGATLSQRPLSSSSEDLSPQEPLVERTEDNEAKEMENLSRKSQWIVLALTSGACAAFNGVFAKLYVIYFSFLRGSRKIMPQTGGGRKYTLFYLRHLLLDEDIHRLVFGLSLFPGAQNMHWSGSLAGKVAFSSPPVG